MTLRTTAQFRKDCKAAVKRGYRMDLLEEVIQALLESKLLAARYRDHALSGDYLGFRECHILPDWLLIYRIDEELLVLTAVRSGTHADLFS